MSFKCPECKELTKVVETRGVERERECKACGSRFHTEEIVSGGLTLRRRFWREKYHRLKKPLTPEQIEKRSKKRRAYYQENKERFSIKNKAYREEQKSKKAGKK